MYQPQPRYGGASATGRRYQPGVPDLAEPITKREGRGRGRDALTGAATGAAAGATAAGGYAAGVGASRVYYRRKMPLTSRGSLRYIRGKWAGPAAKMGAAAGVIPGIAGGLSAGGAHRRAARKKPIEKGWGGDLARGAKNATLKSRLKERATSRAAQRQRAEWAKDYPGGIRRLDAEDAFDDRSHRKSVNFVERFGWDEKDGARRLAKPGLKTSPPRGRSLTPEDRRYLGLPGGGGSGTRQGLGAFRGGEGVDYQFTGNKRVRKIAKRYRDYDSEDRRQRRLGMAQAGALGAGIAGVALGGRGILRSTKAARKITQARGANLSRADREVLARLHRSGVVSSRGDLGRLGAGVAGLGGAGAIRQHAESPRNSRYL